MQTVVWVANRINPINETTGLLKIDSTGNVWSTNTTVVVQNPILQLLETGNLVLRDGKDSSSDNCLWQSFDYPSDTMLPGMKLGYDMRTGFHRRLSAWKSTDDPSRGDLTFGIELQGDPEMVLRKGSEKYYRCGIWNDDGFRVHQITGLIRSLIMTLSGMTRRCCLDGQDIYIKVSASELDKAEDWEANDGENQSQNEDMELEVFDLGTIYQATDTFSVNKKLDEGGFGPVYKILTNGQEIAVKRLSKSSGQGVNEFKNEVKLIAKLQNRNLVRLLGCCIHGEERILVYEYMPNGSLDSFIFGSGLRIIHRDLKDSNVLLDSEMNPKISDFGLARTFGGDQTEANTNRVVGTFDYMAPGYAIDGLFSTKSDVFSFGILLLEIISGRKNRGFFHPNHCGNLIENAWRLWKEGNPLDVADDFLVETGNASEILRCTHISLLCVQQHPDERPNMSSVILMLGSEIELP
ncbi:hypothetical protein PTKIN_Ptkin14bG0068200 [Pterospermum kingtungense]